MTSGLAPVAYDEYQQADDALGALLASPAASPSSGFVYDTPVLDLLVAAIERASGTDVESLANRELLGPLGGRVAHWRRNGNGIPMGGNDAYLRPRDLIRLGELFRRGGTWEGRRLLPAAFVTAATSPLVPTGEPTINHGTLPVRGYGLLWWALAVAGDDDVFAALGHGGQELLVFPSRELVVLMTSRWPGPSSSDHYRHLLRVIEEGILPAFPGENVGRAATVQHRAR